AEDLDHQPRFARGCQERNERMQARVQAISDAAVTQTAGAASVSITVEDSIGVLEQGNKWKLARSWSEGVSGGVGPSQSDLVEDTVPGQRSHRCAIELAVGRLYQGCRQSTVGVIKFVERCQKARGRHFVHRTSEPCGASVGGRTIEIPVYALDWGTEGLVPANPGLKAVQRLVACPVGSDFEYRALVRRAIESGGTVQVAVGAQRQPALRAATPRELVQDFHRPCGCKLKDGAMLNASGLCGAVLV